MKKLFFMTTIGAACIVAGLGTAVPAQAQLKAGLVEDPKVGQDAPDFTLAYLTAEGPGPAGQPFHLRAELGHTVVLVFGTSPEPAAMQKEWETLVAARDSILGP